MKNIFYYLLFLLLVFGCNKKNNVDPNEEGGSNSPLKVEYKKDAVLVEKAPTDIIINIDEEKQVYTLKKSGFKQQPKIGEVILIPGQMMRKVKNIQSKSDQYIIETTDAKLTEVIENGNFSFDLTPDWKDASSIMIAGQEVLTKGEMMSMNPIESEISAGGIDHKIVITPQMTNGRIRSCSFRIEMSKGGSTSFVAEGVATLPQQKTELIIENGKLKKFNSNNSGIKANFSVRMATAGGKSGNHSFKLPKIAISFPIRFIPSPAGPIPNPIPMTIDVGMQLVSEMTIQDPISSATAKSSVSFDANAGFEFKGTEVSSSGSFNTNDIKDGVFDSAASIGMPIDLQFGLAFPRVSFNIAGQEVAFVHIGYTTGSKLTWGPLCKRGYSKLIIEGGYSLSILGQTFSEGRKTFKEYEKRAGDNCDS